MKNLICFILYILSTNIILAQNNIPPKLRLGLQVSPFSSFEVVRFQQIQGTGGYQNEKTQNYALMLERKLGQFSSIETGVNYGIHKADGAYYVDDVINPIKIQQKLEMITIPVLAKYNWGNYFFINGGPILDIVVSSRYTIDNQSGIGLLAGLGAKYNFNEKYSIQINPTLSLHSLIPFNEEKYHQRILESALKFGLYYNFSR